ncbi:SPFH domain-containing protein [Solimicrobium silvestre]|uniref:SPFH domain / Band 7 family n=1 Tax=Solimicrobium silvestre TaxID=2099400 RepID=A0A2S9H405_9BURK|nr:SPFH domain-containing protein [Solimicrobium silvestre]PRC94663.1 SPFH domain / Band 7 family [Solimicrobium silvestre]
MEIFDGIFNHVGIIAGIFLLLIAAIFWKSALSLFGVIMVPDDSLGTVTKKFVLFGANRRMPDGQIIALEGEAGYQADTLPPGLHIGLWPWQYIVELVKFQTIPQGKVGVVQACDGKPLQKGRIIAADCDCNLYQDAHAFLKNGGQRGPQMRVVPPGTYRINPLLFTVKMFDAFEVPSGKLGVVEARDGDALGTGRVIAKGVDCDSYQDPKAFFEHGGQRGPQSKVVPPGIYYINPVLFDVQCVSVVDVPDNKVGIVTTSEGKSLAKGEIAGEQIEGHSMYQDADAFLMNGGHKGLQEQVLLAGRYFINPRFATVEIVEMSMVPIANVGVVIAYVGKEGKDVTGDAFKHGNLVSMGEKGVCVTPLDPGKYPINPYTHKVVTVPTANVVLNWATNKTEAHKLDANLSTITVRSADGFKFNLDVSQIIHIPSKDAPKVIARFGDMSALVTQVLEPTIGNYFRNAAQGSDIIDFLKNRTKRQDEARLAISAALVEYNVGAVDTLIGDIVPPDDLMRTLTDRKIAEQERVTYETQREAQGVRQALEQATALANTQAHVVDAERRVQIAEFEAQAAVKSAEGSAKSKTINAQADATVLRTVGEAEGAKILAVGGSEAKVIQQKVDAMDAGNYAVVQVAEALAKGGIKIVPDIVAGGNSEGGMGGGLVSVLLGNLIRDQNDARKHVAKDEVKPGSAS